MYERMETSVSSADSIAQNALSTVAEIDGDDILSALSPKPHYSLREIAGLL